MGTATPGESDMAVRADGLSAGAAVFEGASVGDSAREEAMAGGSDGALSRPPAQDGMGRPMEVPTP